MLKKHSYKALASSVVLSVSAMCAIAQNKAYNEVTVYTTAQNTDQRIAQTGKLTFTDKKQPLETEIAIFVDPQHTFQTVIGIGGALTDASAETYFKLPKAAQQEFLQAYYDKDKGIGYTWARTSINSTDFSSDTYTYVKDNDAELKSFNLAHDKKYKIPFIKAATQAAGGTLPLFVSPWSPPAWMKTNNSMLKGGKLKPEFAANWANYYVKFIKGYEALGIPIFGLSVQNEPMATQTWESCIYTADEERDFIKNHLGPTLEKNGLGDKKMIAWDHNRDLAFHRASTILNDADAAKYVWGIGYHWYETWTGAGQNFQNIRLIKETFPNINLVFTEGCVEKFDLAKVNDWALGERYGTSLVNDFNNGTVAWTDWNILLDEKGGPNHVGNFCFAPIHADLRSGKLIYTNSYYYLGHFSKFVRPGAKRVVSSASRDVLSTTAFQNTDGSLAVVVLNTSDKSVPYMLWLNGRAAETTSQPHSITTLIVK
ncbi:glycosyl hydrolase [Mucilaginibacter limnophilus]|uniref:Glycosyl hydrolase n=1 Tax=Mucilaginibacter limnophilus TaxID=1932778 RepID=A0A3S3TJF1_9SPHI|nr:glycoside hydrolase family 30 protein [Mucilaginibacter limnophilus]RVU02441.1 glycosyl hydrolase [Mucilaginibacter limnophilus]